ncbi:MAG: hypothetical protein LRS48_04715 [Desulfurococcales archaeon]|nr:hypothetical protein [Desulfurococcales archaeon]
MIKRRSKQNPKKLVIEAISHVTKAKIEVEHAKWRLQSLPDPEAKRIAVKLESLSLLLEKVSLRLNTFLQTGIITRDLVQDALETVKKGIEGSQGLPPALAATLWDLEAVLGDLYENTERALPDIQHIVSNMENSLDRRAEAILSEASRQAEARKKAAGKEKNKQGSAI